MKKLKIKIDFQQNGETQVKLMSMLNTNKPTLNQYKRQVKPKCMHMLFSYALETNTPLSKILKVYDENGKKVNLKDIV